MSSVDPSRRRALLGRALLALWLATVLVACAAYMHRVLRHV
jgi:hypothetical protein